MVGPMEPDHLEGKGLRPINGRIPEAEGQIELLEQHDLLSKHDDMERSPGWSDA